MLVESQCRIVTKDEMLGKVWNGSFVEEGNLPVHISKLRVALGQTLNEHYIETSHGNGYRFVATVEFVTREMWQSEMPYKYKKASPFGEAFEFRKPSHNLSRF